MLGGSNLQWGFDLKIVPDNLIVYADFSDFPHENGIVLSQNGVQANHMNPLCNRHCSSWSGIINKDLSLYKFCGDPKMRKGLLFA